MRPSDVMWMAALIPLIAGCSATLVVARREFTRRGQGEQFAREMDYSHVLPVRVSAYVEGDEPIQSKVRELKVARGERSLWAVKDGAGGAGGADGAGGVVMDFPTMSELGLAPTRPLLMVVRDGLRAYNWSTDDDDENGNG
jgi:hypothetical protein